MSFAPASSRGAFLKARLAVNGIQCAAKSFGTLTAGGCGLLSNMAASSSVVGGIGYHAKLSASRPSGNFNNLRYFRPFERIVASGAQFQHGNVGIERSAFSASPDGGRTDALKPTLWQLLTQAVRGRPLARPARRRSR